MKAHCRSQQKPPVYLLSSRKSPTFGNGFRSQALFLMEVHRAKARGDQNTGYPHAGCEGSLAMWFVPMEGPMEANTAQGRQAEPGLSQHQLRQHGPFQSTPWFTHLTPPRDPAAALAHPPVRSATPAGSTLLPGRLPLCQQTTKKPFSSHQPRPALRSWQAGQRLSRGKVGLHGRSPFPTVLLPLPDPLALPSPPGASDHRRTVSLNPLA